MSMIDQANNDTGMFLITVNKTALEAAGSVLLTSGARNVYPCRFHFSQDWQELDKTAVFWTREKSICVPLGITGECQIPWEVLETWGESLYVGIYGTQNGELVMPTVMTKLGEIHKGAAMGDIAQEPAPEVYEQILALAANAERIAQSVREDADSGRLDGAVGPQGPAGPKGDTGATPVRGEDYWTAEDQRAVVDSVLAALPIWEGGVY